MYLLQADATVISQITVSVSTHVTELEDAKEHWGIIRLGQVHQGSVKGEAGTKVTGRNAAYLH